MDSKFIRVACIFLSLLLSGCATWTNHNDYVEWPNGTFTRINVSADGVLTVKKEGVEITADHRGRPSIVEQILGIGASSVANIKMD
jgi:hypothetical protein